MTDIHSNAALFADFGSHWKDAPDKFGDALPRIALLVVIALASALAAISDPLTFADIFSRM